PQGWVHGGSWNPGERTRPGLRSSREELSLPEQHPFEKNLYLCAGQLAVNMPQRTIRAGDIAHPAFQFGDLRKAAVLGPIPDQRAIHANPKHPAGAWPQSDFLQFFRKGGEQFLGVPGGAQQPVALAAIVNAHLASHETVYSLSPGKSAPARKASISGSCSRRSMALARMSLIICRFCARDGVNGVLCSTLLL